MNLLGGGVWSKGARMMDNFYQSIDKGGLFDVGEAVGSR